jgi:hypothetical protein
MRHILTLKNSKMSLNQFEFEYFYEKFYFYEKVVDNLENTASVSRFRLRTKI